MARRSISVRPEDVAKGDLISGQSALSVVVWQESDGKRRTLVALADGRVVLAGADIKMVKATNFVLLVDGDKTLAVERDTDC